MNDGKHGHFKQTKNKKAEQLTGAMMSIIELLL